MDTSSKSEQGSKRQFRSLQEKLRIVEEASQPGASVAAVALRNGVNANLYAITQVGRRRFAVDQNDGIRPNKLFERMRGR
jgi:transposase-like protein